MINAKKILITSESHEIFILKTGSKGRAFGRCRQCGQEVEILSIDRAVSVSGFKTSDLMRKIDANEIHGIQTESGHILICRESLEGSMVGQGGGK